MTQKQHDEFMAWWKAECDSKLVPDHMSPYQFAGYMNAITRAWLAGYEQARTSNAGRMPGPVAKS